MRLPSARSIGRICWAPALIAGVSLAAACSNGSTGGYSALGDVPGASPSGSRSSSGAAASSGGLAGASSGGGSSSSPGGSSGGGTGAASSSGTSADGGGSSVFPPLPPPYAIAVPSSPQPTGDVDAGYDYLINGPYQRLGPDLAAFKSSQPAITPDYVLPGRTGDNVGLSYMFTAATNDSGDRVAGVNCLACHANHFQGKLTIGIGRPQRMVRLDDVNVLGIIASNPAQVGSSADTLNRLLGGVTMGGVMNVFPYLASHRDPQTLVWQDQALFNSDSGVQGWVDIAPWWRVKKKNALYSNGSGRGVKGHHMSFMSIFSVKDTTEAATIYQHFNDVEAYIESLVPPAYTGNIDMSLASRGETVFNGTCAMCHGTYGKNPTYPNVIIPYDQVGTDPSLATHHWMSPAVDWYNSSWYSTGSSDGQSKLVMTQGYYAPPLDGIWSTAPYLHNGSVQTLAGVIDPTKRLKTWTCSMVNDADFDMQNVGWKDVPGEVSADLNGGFGVFDSTQPGNSIAGHTYGAALSDDDKAAVLEYLKTL